jgi:diamine N-acetyltransferase
MEIKLSAATLNDANAIAALANEIWYEHYPSIITNEQIAYMLDLMYAPNKLIEQMNSGCVFTLAYANNELVGYVSAQLQNNTQLFIHKFYVHAKVRGLKIGENLLKNLQTQYYSHIHNINLVVNRKNYKAINFYFKQGFKIINAFDNDIGGGFEMNDFEMQLNTT